MYNNALSKVVLIAVLAVVVVVGAAGYFLILQQTPQVAPGQINQVPAQPAPQQAPSSPQAPAPVQEQRADALKQAIITHLDKLAARDARGLMDVYIPDRAYAEWANQAGVFAGKYDGTGNIRILWAQIIGNSITIGYRIDNYDAKITGDRAEVRYKLYLNGTGKEIGDFQMEVDAIQKFIYADGKWLMDYDYWNFRVFKTSIVADGTVFPLHWRKLGDYSVWNDRIKDLFSFGRP
ncbi:MAG: hypothetical protein HYY67_07370 [Thaumarchaeota archaeon]|nr:hypothetical protein [Nitrososphaerota archaeon]